MVAAAMAALFLCGCGRAYRPGSLAGGPGSAQLRHGCLDVVIDGQRDEFVDGPVLKMAVGNRCDRAVRIDFAAVRVVGFGSTGDEVPLRFYDPEGVIKAGVLDAKRLARERFELVGELRAGEVVRTVCVELDDFAPTSDGGATRACTAVPAALGPAFVPAGEAG